MSAAKNNLRRSPRGYFERTHRPLNCLVFILPLLAAFEAGALFYRDDLLATRHLAGVLELFGATAHFLPAALVVLVLVIWHALTRQKWQADGDALAGMVVESALATLPLIGLTALTRRLFGPMALSATEAARPGLAPEILSGIGAGIYEEFLFRLAAIALVLFIGVDLLRVPRRPAAALAILFTSVVFSLYHYLGAGGFDWHGFVFRGVAGLYLALLYVGRGFGVAVGAHACYNCYSAIALV